MADIVALDRAEVLSRPPCRTRGSEPPWSFLHRAAGLVGTIGRAIFEASHEKSSPLEFAGRAQRTAQAILRSHGVDVHCSGPVPPTTSLVVSNHVSYLDALVIASLVPCIAIAKMETARWPLFGAGLRALGVVFVSRSDAGSGAVALRMALRALRKGASVLNFPEGTTTDGRSVGPFRRGSFGLARLARVPIVPARIAYEDDRVPWFGGQHFGPHYARLARVPAVEVSVHFGKAVIARDTDDPAELATRARDVICELVNS